MMEVVDNGLSEVASGSITTHIPCSHLVKEIQVTMQMHYWVCPETGARGARQCSVSVLDCQSKC